MTFTELMPIFRRPLFRALLAFGGGASTLLAFAPFSIYPLAVLGPLLLFLLWLDASPRRAFRDGWFFGLGLLGFGVSWLHISIDEFGNVGTPLAVFITALFIALLSLFYGLVGWLGRVLTANGLGRWERLLLFTSLWVLAEWLRGWLFSGFPWLSLGYSQIDSPLAGWATVFGVYGVSWAVVLTAAGLVLSIVGTSRQRLAVLSGLLLLWGAGLSLKSIDWSIPSGDPLRVAMIQGNVPQQEKWKRRNLVPTLDLYARLSRRNWDRDLIIWPETAVPAFSYQVEKPFLDPLHKEAVRDGVTILLGIPEQKEGGRYFNSMVTLGDDRNTYHKRHLVPFGEFMPLKFMLQPLIDWLQIPMSDFTAGEAEKPLMTVAGHPAAISICYEDVFGEEVIEALPEAAFLVNASNDAWFGDSLAPPQHLEIARMRSMETGRYLLRSTNTGISALIGPKGEVIADSPAFEQHVLRGEVRPMKGLTPYGRTGNLGVVLLSLLVLAVITGLARSGNRDGFGTSS